MPRDINGNYTLPAGNPVQSGTLIESSWANNTAGDLATEMTDSLSRSGKGGLTGPLGIVDLSGAVPGLNFINEPTSGLKRVAGGDVRMQVLGGDRMRWRSGVSQRPEVQIDAAWQPLAIEPADRKVMYGAGGITASWFYNNTVPPGWTLSNPDSNLRNLAIAPGGATPVGGGTVAGVDDPSNLTKDISHTPAGTVNAADAPHTHGVSGNTGPGPSASSAQGSGSEHSTPGHTHSVSITSGGASGNANHAHGFTGTLHTDDVTFNPRRAMGVIGVLDA